MRSAVKVTHHDLSQGRCHFTPGRVEFTILRAQIYALPPTF